MPDSKEAEIYNNFVKESLSEDYDIYILPKFEGTNATILKRDNNISIYSNHQNQDEYFPDLKDITRQIDTKNTILQVSIFELDMDKNIKNSDPWFSNSSSQPDGVRIVVKDCYYYGNKVILDKSFKKRFKRLREVVHQQEEVGIYEVLPLPYEKIENLRNPAEFQAILDWVTDLEIVDSNGAIVRDSSSTVFDKREKII